jgi:hypothetical protein
MPADQLRNRTVGSKMTENEYEQLVAVAEREALSIPDEQGRDRRRELLGSAFHFSQPMRLSGVE